MSHHCSHLYSQHSAARNTRMQQACWKERRLLLSQPVHQRAPACSEGISQQHFSRCLPRQRRCMPSTNAKNMPQQLLHSPVWMPGRVVQD